jgi:hypothetical protein
MVDTNTVVIFSVFVWTVGLLVGYLLGYLLRPSPSSPPVQKLESIDPAEYWRHGRRLDDEE